MKIDLSISFDFLAPKCPSCLRPFEEMTIVPVPEAAMDEDYGAMLWKDKVWLPWQAPVVQHVAKAFRMKASPDDHFRLGILSPDA